MIKHILFISTTVLVIIALNACSSRQEIHISNSGEGSVLLDVNLNNMVVQYSRDLLEGFSDTENKEIKLFDTNKIHSIISKTESLSLASISSKSPNILNMELNFKNLGNIFNTTETPGIPNIISFSKRNSGNAIIKQVKLHLSQKNFNAVTTLLGMEKSEIMDTFGPQENPYSKYEYMDLIEYLFEEYESPLMIRSILKSSEVIINLNVDGKIIECYGCKGSGSSVEIKIPLLDIVTLKKPIEIIVEWE